MIPSAPSEGNVSPPIFFSPGAHVYVITPRPINMLTRLALPSFFAKMGDFSLRNPGQLAKNKNVIQLKPEQVLSRMLSTLNTLATQAIQMPQAQKNPEQPVAGKPKSPETQRDETNVKGNTNIGEDLVNIQVFASDKGSQKESQSGTKDSPVPKQEVPSKSMAKEPEVTPQKPMQSTDKPELVTKTVQSDKEPQGDGGKQIEKTPSTEIKEKAPAPKMENRAGDKPETVKPETASQQETKSQDVGVMQEARVVSGDVKERPERTQVAEKEREKVEEVQGSDKYRAIEHPSGHRVMEHGRVEHRVRPDDTSAQQPSNINVQHRIDPDNFVPAFSGWYLPTLVEEDMDPQGKSRSGKVRREMIEHNLGNLLFMILSAALGGAKTIAEVVNFIEAREKWFRVILGLRHGLPSRQMIWWFLSVLDPKSFQQAISPWLREVQGKAGSANMLPHLSLWETPIGLLFGQSQKGDDMLDTLAVPQLLRALDLHNAVVMTQSVDPQAQSAALIERKGGGYLVEIDESTGEAYEHLKESLNKGVNTSSVKTFESYVEGQERIMVQVLQDNVSEEFNSPWGKGVKAFAKVVHETPMLVGENAYQRYYASSVRKVEDILFDLMRVQAQVENKVDWLLNISFQIPSFSSAMKQCEANISLFQDYAVHLIEQDQDKSLTVPEKMSKAAADGRYLHERLVG